MRRAERLFQLVHLLSRRRFATATELAERLEVSPRTVYRDVSHLISSGVPILGEAGVGYRLDPSYRLPPLMFTRHEVEALVIGLRMIETWGDQELGQAARAVIDKVSAAIPSAEADHIDHTALFSLRFGRKGDTAAHLTQLRRAINQTLKLDLRYSDVDGTDSERRVRPLGLYFWGQTWTVAAWCELRSAFRNFRVDRIRAVTPTDEPFALVHPCTLEEYTRSMFLEVSPYGLPDVSCR
jgi:predicted DNA-binding transcriptional regulator YafY